MNLNRLFFKCFSDYRVVTIDFPIVFDSLGTRPDLWKTIDFPFVFHTLATLLGSWKLYFLGALLGLSLSDLSCGFLRFS